MDYKPVTAVWEITMGCNMRCKHCGSSCSEVLEDELITPEALNLCDQIGDLGLRWITLSGGEPTIRGDLEKIIKRLRKNDVVPNIITNGWSLDKGLLKRIIDAGVGTIGVSIDGLEKTHDFIRKKGSYKRIMSALDILKEMDVYTGVITTINKKNIDELKQLMEILISKNVDSWQLQIGLPMGNFEKNNEMVIEAEQINDIIDFAYEAVKANDININLADCIGYYNLKEIEVRKKAVGYSGHWNGCSAGKQSFGILYNGDILGCTSIRDRSFIEGNIRERSLKEVWESNIGFSCSRDFKKEDLNGICKICRYGDVCLGGCPNTRLVLGGDIYSENKYCSYNLAIQKAKEMIDKIENVDELISKGRKLAEKNKYQLAGLLIEKALKYEDKNIELLNLYGYISFMLKNYNQAIEANRKVLEQDPDNVYANKGMGLSLCKAGEIEKGFKLLEKSIRLTDKSYMDPYYDFAVVLAENNRIDEAINILNKGRKISSSFRKQSQQLYDYLLSSKKTKSNQG